MWCQTRHCCRQHQACIAETVTQRFSWIKIDSAPLCTVYPALWKCWKKRTQIFYVSFFPVKFLRELKRHFFSFTVKWIGCHQPCTLERPPTTLPFFICSFWWCSAVAAECEWQAAESETRCEYCVKGQTHDDNSSCNGWASLLKVGLALPSGTATELCSNSVPCKHQIEPVCNGYPITGKGKKKIWLLQKKKKLALGQKIIFNTFF